MLHPDTSQVPATIADKLLGGYPVSLLCTVTNTWKTPTRCTKNTCAHLKNSLVSMPSAKAIKARNRKYYKRNAESITSQSREKYSTNPGVQKIDRALCSGDFHTLMEITKISDFKTLLSNEIDTSYEQCTEAADYVLTHAGVENELLIEHA